MRSAAFTLTLAAIIIVPTFAFAEPGPMAACRSDLQSLCAGVQPGGGRIRGCMREHRTQLSAACKIALADRMLERGGQRGARAQGTMEHGPQGTIEHSRQSVIGNTAIKPVPPAGDER